MSAHLPKPISARPAGRSRSILFKIAAATGIVLASFAQGTLPVLAQGEVRSAHGDWQMRCDTPPGASSEQCALIQNVTAADRENVGLSVIILKTADKQARILRVLAPLGVLLPSGLGLRVDNADIGRAGFVRCLPNGCIAEVILEEDLLTKLQTGAQATFIIFQTPEEGIGIPISLDGFSAGFEALP
ncbi:invasion associated locus B family protein [Roseibium marinum]|uniref:Invasion protein IalB n=1 Tax=Roseibium marinum TaxID=281252 RepID=A0A2S3V4K6_9HYPH|nr:invasion protein IalB [Roseibium marinum]